MRKKSADEATLRMLEVWFKAWTVTYEQESRIKRLRKTGFDFAKAVVETMDEGKDRDEVLHYIRLAVVIARDSIANELAHGEA